MNKIENKVCATCNEEKSLSDYYTQKKYSKEKGNWIYYNPECKECAKKRSGQWNKENLEGKRRNAKRWRENNENRELKRERVKRYVATGKYKEWQNNNKDSLKKYAKYREMNKKHTITKAEWNQCKEYFNNECAYCGLSEKEHRNKYNQQLHKEHVDHNGSNGIENCVPSCKVCNGRKNIFELKDWYIEQHDIYSEERINKVYKWLEDDVYKLSTNILKEDSK